MSSAIHSRSRPGADESSPAPRGCPELSMCLCPSDMEDLREALAEHGQLRLLNTDLCIGRDVVDWHLGPRKTNRLQVATLHYHEWLAALAKAITEEPVCAKKAGKAFNYYLEDWLANCRLGMPGSLELAWNPFTVATRIIHWMNLHKLAADHSIFRDEALEGLLLGSLYDQAEWLYRHIEWDLRGNHLMRDAVGLAAVGRFFQGRSPDKWLRRATEIAVSQIDEQILPDGAHFERSPMYHIQVMGDILLLSTLLKEKRAQEAMHSAWSRMAEFTRWTVHPDGRIPLLNDAAFNGACAPDAMLSLGEKSGIRISDSTAVGGKHFENTGLVVWRDDLWSLFFDAGPLGPDYQPGHGHADTLSIECSYNGKRLFVDPGTYGYDRDERRRYDRSTATHNTVSVDGEDSSEVWHIFRVGRRAKPFDVSVTFANSGLLASASHNGYMHLLGAPVHNREIRLSPGGVLHVLDRITGEGNHRIECGLLVGPGWEVREAASGWDLTGGNDRLSVEVEGPSGMQLSLVTRRYHPEFGLELDRPRLQWYIEGPLPIEVAVRVVRG